MKRLVVEIRRYSSLIYEIAKNCFQRELQYPVNFFVSMFVEVFWQFTLVIMFLSLYQFIDLLGGWTKGELWCFLGSLFICDAYYMFFLDKSKREFTQYIRHGIFDFYLLKPVSAFFLSNFRFYQFTAVYNFFIGIALIAWGVVYGNVSLGFSDILVWIVYQGLGLVLLTCLSVVTNSLAFWTINGDHLPWLFFEFYQFAWRPDNLYSLWVRRILLGIFPAAFITSIPVKLALGKVDGIWFLWPFVMCLLFVSLTRLLWVAGLRRYEGAMS